MSNQFLQSYIPKKEHRLAQQNRISRTQCRQKGADFGQGVHSVSLSPHLSSEPVDDSGVRVRSSEMADLMYWSGRVSVGEDKTAVTTEILLSSACDGTAMGSV